ncbi:hypothetical protein GCM10023196_061430 [Actinoallomurus vinaceus]|uniref:Uncharacterized protein n=1 Tax=Actinoallomurus vinaceus TaxID=1080074 RepID=A0ABP8UGE7_9ACTN
MPDNARFRWITPGRGLAALAAIAVIAAAIWFLVLPHFTLRHESKIPLGNGRLGAACGNPGVAYTSAHPFAGPSPHSVEVFEKYGKSYINAGATLPDSWNAPTHADVRLVLCLEKVGTDGEMDNVSCKYGNRQLPSGPQLSKPMDKTIYRATLRELRTHRRLSQVTLTGEDGTCPGSVSLSDSDPTLDSHPSKAQLLQAFGRYAGTF